MCYKEAVASGHQAYATVSLRLTNVVNLERLCILPWVVAFFSSQGLWFSPAPSQALGRLQLDAG